MWCGVVWWGSWRHVFFTIKNALLFKYYLVCHIQLVTCISVCHAGVYIEVMQWSEQAIRQKQRWLKSNMHTDNDTRSHIHARTHTRMLSRTHKQRREQNFSRKHENFVCVWSANIELMPWAVQMQYLLKSPTQLSKLPHKAILNLTPSWTFFEGP